MTLEFARQLALSLLESKVFVHPDYCEAGRVLAADFAAHPIKKAPQSQADVTTQLRQLVPIANNAGLYDAADHITQQLGVWAKRAERREKLKAENQQTPQGARNPGDPE